MGLSKLGKSFSELIEANKETAGEEVIKISVDSIRPNRNQPRRHFDDKALGELSQSLKAHGLLQPIVVVKATGGYELVAGERRWRAAQMLGWKTILCRVVDLDESHSLQVALIENLQREGLNPIDMALSYKELITRFGLTQQQVATQVGKERSTIANTLRLLELPAPLQKLLEQGALSMGHARALLGCKTPEQMRALADKVVKQSLSVRAVEQLVSQGGETEVSSSAVLPKNKKGKVDPNLEAVSQEFSNKLGTRVQVSQGGKKGKITIEFYSLDDFDRLKNLMIGHL